MNVHADGRENEGSSPPPHPLYLTQCLDDKAHCRGRVARGVVRVVPGKGPRPVIQHSDQSPGRDVFADGIVGHPGQTMPAQRRGDDHVAGVEDQPARDVRVDALAPPLELPGQQSAV